jgi:hypothetical protein
MRITAVSRHPWRRLRECGALAGAATLTAAIAVLATGSPAAQAVAVGHRAGASAPDATSSLSVLTGVSAVSAADAWAAGSYDNSSGVQVPLIERWNGTAWKTVTSPAPSGATSTYLSAVSAASATDAWAAGYYQNSSGTQVPLILHWNGTAWKTVTSPAPSGATSSGLNGLSAVSATDAWAVGSYFNSGGVQVPLTEHWNGTAWKTVPSPAPSGATSTNLDAVSADSATDAWAAGRYVNSSNVWEPLIMRWNGTAWKRAASPAPSEATTSLLNGLSAHSATDAWAAGSYQNSSGAPVPLTERWNGTAWKTVTSPAPSGATSIDVSAVSAVSAADAWVAGYYQNSSGTQVPLIMRWNGTAWKTVTSPAPSGATSSGLNGVSAVSAADAWAAGTYNDSGVIKTLIMRWNGTAWKKVTSPNGT